MRVRETPSLWCDIDGRALDVWDYIVTVAGNVGDIAYKITALAFDWLKGDPILRVQDNKGGTWEAYPNMCRYYKREGR